MLPFDDEYPYCKYHLIVCIIFIVIHRRSVFSLFTGLNYLYVAEVSRS